MPRPTKPGPVADVRIPKELQRTFDRYVTLHGDHASARTFGVSQQAIVALQWDGRATQDVVDTVVATLRKMVRRAA